jgi:hypothetical protein
VDDHPVGFALVRMLSEVQPHLEELDVVRSQGRRGIGSALVRAVSSWAFRSGYMQLTLDLPVRARTCRSTGRSGSSSHQ